MLARHFGDIDTAEEAVQDAFTVATERWRGEGLPPSPSGWIITTARHRAIDRFRREASREDRHAQADWLRMNGPEHDDAPAVPDDRLRLIFTCCHPALSNAARVALTLRLLGGLTTAEIARAFLVPEATMAQRLVRAKGKIRDAGIPYRVPGETDLPARLDAVLSVVYLVFNEGYTATSGDRLAREDLAAEAIRLGRLLRELLSGEPEVAGLLALMLFIDARRATRMSPHGGLVRLADQDRSRWDRDRIEQAGALLGWARAQGRPGAYQIQAAIQAEHARAPSVGQTDWRAIRSLYDELLRIAPSPVVALHRTVSVAEVDGPEAALAQLETLELDGYYLFHAIRGDLLERLGRRREAAAAFAAARNRTDNLREREFLDRRRGDLSLV